MKNNMNPEINDNEDIFDIAISMQYFKNHIMSSDTIHDYAKHFLYKAVYKKLLSFSKEELETVFWDTEKKEFHPNPKSKLHSIKFQNDIFDATLSLKNPLFFAAFIEKNVFKEKYHVVVKNLLKNKKTPHSLDFLECLFHIQSHLRSNSIGEDNNLISSHDYSIFNYTKNLDTEEKNALFVKHLDLLIKESPKCYVEFLFSHIKEFNEQHIIITQAKTKEYGIDINDYLLFENIFPAFDKNDKSRFFISSNDVEKINKLFDYGFRAKNYSYEGLNLLCALYTHDLGYNNVGDKFAVPFIQKIIKESSYKEIEEFILYMPTDISKLKKYGHYFESFGKEALNKKLHEKLSELPKVKQPKI